MTPLVVIFGQVQSDGLVIVLHRKDRALVPARTVYRGSKCVSDAPACAENAHLYCAVINSGFAAPLGRSKAPAIKLNENRVPLPFPLFKRRRPPAIRFLIDAVRIRKPVERLASWSLAHVGEEVHEFIPTLADCDPATAIVLVIVA